MRASSANAPSTDRVPSTLTPAVTPVCIPSDGLGLGPAPPEGGRGIVADVIGELAWAVTFYGGNIIMVPEGTLGDFDGIVLITDGGM